MPNREGWRGRDRGGGRGKAGGRGRGRPFGGGNGAGQPGKAVPDGKSGVGIVKIFDGMIFAGHLGN